MTRSHPSPVPSGHPLPQGEREVKNVLPQGEREVKNVLPQGEREGNNVLPQGESKGIRPLSQIAREQRARRKDQPSPLAGEGGSARLRALTGEGFAKSQVKRLRKEMTEAETRLWQHLRAKRFEDFKFRRQVAIGRYIADFVCYAHRLIVEVDGSQHDDCSHDAKRDDWLRSQGFRIVRLWNNGVLNDIDGALLTILDALKQPPPASPGRGLKDDRS